MIGLDTNILVRYLVKDDPEQTRLAVNLIYSLTPAEPGWVAQATMLELVWALTRIYRVKRNQAVAILDTLLASRYIVIEQDEIARASVRLYRAHNIDFADCLISCGGKAAGCSKIMTFDRKAARDAGMELVD